MRFVEPISSAVLVTACVYSAGISQNNAFLRTFNLHPEFSQPALDKLLYDGGIIFCDILFSYLVRILDFFVAHPYSFSLGVLVVIFVWGKMLSKSISHKLANTMRLVGEWSGVLLVVVLFYMTFAAYDKGQEDGVKIAKILLDNCYEVKVTSDGKTSTGCAFRKDKDSIWYYTSRGEFKVFSETLTETSKIEYAKPLPRYNSKQEFEFLEQMSGK
ncbi:hypothetical protein KSS92_04755 [Pseudomonas atacamensis]|uniref:hypothetical protein n=1 Tax=Pseudomonas atacamensis TaxID=2565368 RepID=UPI001C3CDED6|nr:hypothetical protein [Pseudomonas atacamensis]QXH73823.1 hypothetical protein KSS92_04755 [Pseudomonas atacamensis]